MTRRTITAILLTLLLAATNYCALAQTAGQSAVTGTVRDSSGAVVPGATVTLTNESKGVRRVMQTNEAGLFTAPALVPSPGYMIDVTKAGFAKYDVKEFNLAVGQIADFQIVLTVGTTSTTVEITGEAPLVESTKPGVSGVVGSAQIDELPINGRRADTYGLMMPGVTNDGEFGLITFRGIAAGNSFMTDGNDTTNSFYNENAGRTRIGSQLSQDAVQEFQVLSNNFSAEFGRAMGGVINTVTRSGGNGVHGTAYWFFRNRTLEAADRYAAGVKGPEWRHTAGGSIGGPIKKDKLFYFLNYDLTKRNFPGFNRIINNAFTDPSGNTIPASSCTATAAQCAAAIGFISRQMNVMVPRSYNQSLGFAKLDWRAGDKDSFTFMGNLLHWVSPHGIQTQTVLTGGAMIGDNGNSTVESRYGKASWTRIVSNNAVNEFRFGWFKDRLSDPASGDLWPKETGGLYINVAGATIGASRGYPRTYPSENRYQFADNLNWTAGAHTLKFGFDMQTTQDWMNQLYNGLGAYSYSNLTNFAKDFNGGAFNSGARNYSNFQQAFGNPIFSMRTTDFTFFAQDSWKATRRLTLNYGVRYEKSLLPQPTITNKDWPATGFVPSPNNEFAPRFGLSYMVNDKTVIRGGYGIFFARFHGNLMSTLFLGNGQYQTSIYVTPSQAGAPIFPNVFSSSSGLPGASVKLGFAGSDFHAPYTQQGTIAIERQIAKDTVLTTSYIWSRGIGLFTQRDVNLGAPGATKTYTIQDAAGNNVSSFTTPVFVIGNRVDPRYSQILQVENGGQSWYNGLAVQVQKRMSHGFQAQLSYTWSHAIDTANQQGASWNVGSNYNNSTYPGDYTFDKGSSSLDQRHRFSFNWIWMLPKFSDGQPAVIRALFNGWQLSTITTMASAKPWTATMASVSTSANGVFPGITLANNTLNGAGGWNRVPWLPVGTLNVDQIYKVDARITRTFRLTERMKLNFVFEAFNAFNTINNTSVQTQAYYVASGGIIKPQLTNGVSLVGTGSASQGFPDGTNARRAQAAMRFTF